MGRRALIIALASFLVIAVGAALTWAILASGAPVASPTTAPPEPTSGPVDTPDPEPSSTGTPQPTPAPTGEPTTGPKPAPPAVTAVAAKPAPHSVALSWTNPQGADVAKLVIVQAPGAVVPGDTASGTVIATLNAAQTAYTDTSAALVPGKKFSYAVFAANADGATSPAAGLSVTLPAALVVTPVDVSGDVTQQAGGGTLTDTGSIAFTAFTPKGPRIAAVLPGKGVTGTLTRTVTEPVGSGAGLVAWTYTVDNAALRSLGEGAKREESFVIELRDGVDKVATPVTVSLHGINDAPVVAAPPVAQAAIVGEPFLFPIPAGTFSDVDATDTLLLSTSPLPSWLSLSSDTLAGVPQAGDSGTTTVTITATDPSGASVSTDVTIDVADPLPAPNQPPVAGADAVTFDLGADPLQTDASVLGNDSDPDAGPNALAVLPADADWMVNGEVAGHYTLDASGALHLDSGVVADGPLQRLGPGEQATGTITYSLTDGTDTVTGTVTVTAVGPATKSAVYPVTKVLTLPSPPARELGPRIHS